MNSEQLFSDQHSGKYVNTDLKIEDDQVIAENISVLNQLTTNKKSILTGVKSNNLTCETKGKNIDETDDSFEIFLPLRAKSNNNKDLKRSTSSSSPSKSKKKKTNSSNRICPYFFSKKPTSSKEDKDLQLALARSLVDISPGDSSARVLKKVISEKNSQQNTNFLKSLTNKSKKPGTNTLLFRRTREERQNILTQKVGILLLEKENINEHCFQKREVELTSSHLEEAWDKDSILWERSKREVINLAEFYVACLQKFIEQPSAANIMADSTTTLEEEQQACLSGVEEIKREKADDQLGENESVPNEGSFESTNELTSFNNKVDCNDGNTSNKDKYTANSLKTLSDDLSALFSSEILSDCKVILKSGEYLPCHKFILHARCPAILRNSVYVRAAGGLDFSQYSVRATRAFFKYIYTGKIDTIYHLLSEDKSDLYVLSKKYNVEFLKEFMLAEFRSNSLLLYSQDTCSPPHTPSRLSQNSIQNVDDNISSFHLKSENPPLWGELELPNNMQLQEVNEFCSDVLFPVDHQPSCSGIRTSKIASLDTPFSFLADDNSSCDIFEDDIKSPYNNCISQTKRKLNYYSTDRSELKRNRTGRFFHNTTKDIQKIIILDSDSDDEDPIIEKNPSNSTKHKEINMSCFDILGPVNQQPSCSGINMPKQSSLGTPISFLSDHNSSYDIFKYDFKSPCNSSILLQDVSLNKDRNESEKKNCSEKYIPEVIIDSDSDDKYNNISNNSVRVKSESTSDVQIEPSRSSPSKIQKRSIDKYFEASFPDIDETTCNMDVRPKQTNLSTPSAPIVRNPSSNSAVTPLQEIIIHDATPKPDFDSMISPQLKIELKKYGLKPNLERRKARTLLRYIYDQIHPLVDDLSEYKSSVPSTSHQLTPPVVISDDESSNSDQTDGQFEGNRH